MHMLYVSQTSSVLPEVFFTPSAHKYCTTIVVRFSTWKKELGSAQFVAKHWESGTHFI